MEGIVGDPRIIMKIGDNGISKKIRQNELMSRTRARVFHI